MSRKSVQRFCIGAIRKIQAERGTRKGRHPQAGAGDDIFLNFFRDVVLTGRIVPVIYAARSKAPPTRHRLQVELVA